MKNGMCSFCQEVVPVYVDRRNLVLDEIGGVLEQPYTCVSHNSQSGSECEGSYMEPEVVLE